MFHGIQSAQRKVNVVGLQLDEGLRSQPRQPLIEKREVSSLLRASSLPGWSPCTHMCTHTHTHALPLGNLGGGDSLGAAAIAGAPLSHDGRCLPGQKLRLIRWNLLSLSLRPFHPKGSGAGKLPLLHKFLAVFHGYPPSLGTPNVRADL